MNEVLRRFWSKVDKMGDCWLWTGAANHKGYGRFKVRNKLVLPHRLSYELAFGPVHESVVIRHSCDNPRCVNPAHLSAGSQSENMLDAARKGRLGTQVDPSLQVRGEAVSQSRLTADQVTEIRRLHAEEHLSRKKLAEMFGVHRTAIGQIIRRDTWKHI